MRYMMHVVISLVSRIESTGELEAQTASLRSVIDAGELQSASHPVRVLVDSCSHEGTLHLGEHACEDTLLGLLHG